MRRAFLLSAVAASALIASGAIADVTVTGTVDICTADLPCQITVTEDLTKTKTVSIDVVIVQQPEKFAEAWTHFNQLNDSNHACENCAEKLAEIINSIGQLENGNTGITSVNQAAGNNINQGTIITIAVDEFTPPQQPPPPEQPPGSGGFAESQVAGDQRIVNHQIHSFNIAFRDALITGSINDNTGITAVNQAVGNVYNQANAISIAVSLQNGVALSDAALGQFVTRNTHDEVNVSKHAIVTDSIQSNTGITQVNTSAGNLGNQSNVVSIAATFSTGGGVVSVTPLQ